MKKAIAMKCSQKQFDAIKDKLVGCEILDISSFKQLLYLANDYNKQGLNFISNVSGVFNYEYGREVYETWNEEIFLNACGIETERIFEYGELQVWDGIRWNDSNNKYRLKPANLIKKQELESQILELQNQLKNL